MDQGSPSMLKASLIGGVVAGALSALPVVGYLNCFCCALVIGGGVLAAWIYSKDCQRAGSGFRPGSGGLVGLICAPFYAVAHALVGALVRAVMPKPSVDDIREMWDWFGIPEENLEMAERFMEYTQQGVSGLIFAFSVALLLGAAFCTVGGLIGGAVFRVESPAPPPPPVGGGSAQV
jgi:hypothetical protein